ncbi:hypothetical protein C8J56DRAFT_1023248 [Mycena floridula]|nr:hypothetical protein C8J56DRAFT_1023248 [Mycena floridula]
MLRVIARDVALQRATFRRPRHEGIIFSRFSSNLPPSTSQSSSSSQPPLIHVKSSQRKAGLNPAPMNPKTSTVTAAFPTPLQPAPAFSEPKPEPKGVKETIQADIQQAEDMGILIPTPPDANAPQRFLHKTIQMMKFYFRGAKLIYTRGRDISDFKARAKAGGQPVQRRENRLIHVQARDVNKVIPFVVLALLLEEVIPLLALYAPFMLPSTCLLPAQQRRIELKKNAKAISVASLNAATFAQLRGASSTGLLPIKSLLTGDAPTALCSLLRLPTFGIDYLRVFRIHRHLSFVTKDDQLLIRDKLVNQLALEELDEALQERGFIIEGLSTKDKTSKLQWWLDSVKTTAAEDSIPRRLSLLVERK